MAPPLPLPHALLLLELDDVTGRSRMTECAPHLAMAAAFLAELQLADRLFAPSAHHVARRAGPPLPGLLGVAEGALPDRPVRVDEAIGHIAGSDRALRAGVLGELVACGALEALVDRFLRIPYAWRWPTADHAVEAGLVEHLRAWADRVRPDAPAEREDVLLSLLEATFLCGQVWSEAELPGVRERIHLRARLAPIGGVLTEVFQAHRAAMMA